MVKGTTTHQYLFLTKDYLGNPDCQSIYNPWTEAETVADLLLGWGKEAIAETKLELSGPMPLVLYLCITKNKELLTGVWLLTDRSGVCWDTES